MYKRRRINVLIIGVIVLSLTIIISLVYAGFTGQLNITGTSTARQSNWDIHFENLSNVTTTGSAKVLTQPSLESSTSIEDYDVTVTSPGDTISFTFKVVNDGNYNASISSVSVGTPECSGTDSTSNTNVCGKLTYTLTYEGGATVQTGDTLYAKDYAVMKVTLTYQDFSDASLLPTADVSISNLGITINYGQSGSALVKDNGEVANYRVYHQGDKITLNNEDYWVIANSGAGQDYVVLLKENPLTYSEINDYKGENSFTAYNLNGYGIMPFGTNDEYTTSYVKSVVEEWANDKFQSNELKVVDGYRARLIMKTEYETISSEYAWRYISLRRNWTMSKVGGYGYVYVVQTNGSIGTSHYGGDGGAAPLVRPVINVYKSALETNNNSNNNPE